MSAEERERMRPRERHNAIDIEWPIFKWSHDDKYFARMTGGAQGMISVYEAPSMGLLDKKSIKIEHLMNFSWSPKDYSIAYWTPEYVNTPARVTLMEIPSRKILRTKNLFSVSDVSWGIIFIYSQLF